jgi:hypothetical protein
VFVTVPIQLSHERRQVFWNLGASGVGEFGAQSGRKRLQERHGVEGDGGQTAHPNAPTDLPWPNRSVSLGPTVRSRLCREYDGRWFCSEEAARFLRANGAEPVVLRADNELAMSKGRRRPDLSAPPSLPGGPR